MKIYRSFESIDYNKNTVLTVGTFDGVHKGHRKILNRLNEIAKQNSLRELAITFNPHPQIVLNTPEKKEVYLLSTIEERIQLFENIGIDSLLIIPFTFEFSRISPLEFIKNYLSEKVGFKKILIGYDHLFGKNREGNEDLLLKLSKDLDFEIEKISPYFEDEIIISSTKIRHAIQNKNIEFANQMLSYPYIVSGKVFSDAGRGRQIGFPTANIDINDKYKLIPPNGVYAVSSIIDGQLHYGMACIGTRPTFTDDDTPTLEVNFFNFNKDIYNSHLTISFLSFIRDEKKFSGPDELIFHLKEDEKIIRKLLGIN